MRKSIIIVALVFATLGCTKKNENTKPTKNASDLVAQIDAIGNSYKSKSSTSVNTLGHKTTTRKAVLMGIADAIGGAMSSGTPAGIWGTLWGGFLASIGVGSVLDVVNSNPVLPSSQTTESSKFIYGYIGDDHNSLLYQAFNNKISISVNNNAFDQATQNLFTGNNFSNIDGGNDDISTLLSNNQGSLATLYSYVLAHANDANFSSEIISQYSSDNSVNSVLTSIINGITNDVKTLADCHSYLIDVQSAVKQSQDLTDPEKDIVYNFISIENSSLYFWDANGYPVY